MYSGAMYAGVPVNWPPSVERASARAAMPKSITRATPSSSIRMLLGFRSR
ncbi:MAG: hypothetical protein AW07_00345 [Candidatus Accumulibacter sp. SK-11]|nr:MAG: hypothetical protein AW07_00345 [Candidatus Accumulibacter sp. SK-11]